MNEGALLQAFLERELGLSQQMLHRTLVFCFHRLFTHEEKRRRHVQVLLRELALCLFP